MATVTRILVNPTKRRKATTKPKRRAVAKVSRKRAAAARSQKRKNPGALTVLGIVNPTKGKSMKKRTKKNPAKRSRRRNPVTVISKAKRSGPRRRRNPNLVSKGADMLKTGTAALAGLVVTRQAPQMILGTKNTGPMGYLANLFAAILAAWAASRFVSKQIGAAVGIGGGLYLANRIISEQFSPIGKVLSLSGVGDAAACGTMGGWTDAYFPTPVVYENGRPQVPALIQDVARSEARAVAAPPASKVAGYRMGRRAA